MSAIVAANDDQFDRVAALVVSAGRSAHPLRVCVLGLTFKAGTDDLRDSPALAVIDRLVTRGADLVAVARVMRGDTVVDARNVLDEHDGERAGLHYTSIGRSPV